MGRLINFSIYMLLFKRMKYLLLEFSGSNGGNCEFLCSWESALIEGEKIDYYD